MKAVKIVLGLAVLAACLAAPAPFTSGDALAQAQCRQKCIDEEQACLKRTGNKGQCGGKAGECLAKCK